MATASQHEAGSLSDKRLQANRDCFGELCSLPVGWIGGSKFQVGLVVVFGPKPVCRRTQTADQNRWVAKVSIAIGTMARVLAAAIAVIKQD